MMSKMKKIYFCVILVASHANQFGNIKQKIRSPFTSAQNNASQMTVATCVVFCPVNPHL